jgi:hypothetical protein
LPAEAAEDWAVCGLFKPLLTSPNLGEEGDTLISLKVFHSPQAGHLPIHFGDSCPQLEQTYAILSFAISATKVILFGELKELKELKGVKGQ